MAQRPLTLIVAATPSHAIGRSCSLPWRLPKEMAYFARVTKGQAQNGKRNAVIMGRKSWEGIPTKFRPLSERVNVVVSRQSDYDLCNSADTHLAHSLPDAVTSLDQIDSIDRTFLIGGAQLYSLALTGPSSSTLPYTANRVLLTRLKTEFDNCDAYLEPIPSSKNGEWTRASHEELCQWVGFDVPEGDQVEKDRSGGGEVTYEFQMWTR